MGLLSSTCEYTRVLIAYYMGVTPDLGRHARGSRRVSRAPRKACSRTAR